MPTGAQKNISKNTKVSGSQSSKDLPRKLLIRGCEVPVRKSTADSDTNENDDNTFGSSEEKDENNLLNAEKCGTTSQYSEPQICSSLRIRRGIEKVKNNGCRTIKAVPKTEQPAITPQAVKKINIPLYEEVYKDLINLKVNDEDIGVLKTFPLRSREVTRNKDPEPVLTDFYKPEFNKEYVVKSVPPTYEVEKVWTYDGFGVSNMIEKWEPKF